MTKSDIAKIFAKLSLAFPQAAIFKQDETSLEMTIELWEQCLSDIPYSKAASAVIEISKEMKFMPGISEFREMASKIDTPDIKLNAIDKKRIYDGIETREQAIERRQRERAGLDTEQYLRLGLTP